MARSRLSNETAKALVNPLFAWSNAMLKGGELMLDSMQAAAKTVRVAVLDADRPAPHRAKARPRRAKAKRRR